LGEGLYIPESFFEYDELYPDHVLGIYFFYHSFFSPIFAESRIVFSTLPDLAGWRGI
jgi:hypothetical protein